jgi:multidrug resistance efflux pump
MRFLPSEFIQNGIDAYLARSAVRFHWIYWLFILVIVAAGATLPFIYVDVSVQEAGMIRPAAEKTEIRASISETVDSVFVREGQSLTAGDTILTFLRSNPEYRIDYQQKRLEDFEAHIADLHSLAAGSAPKAFASPARRQEYLLYLQQVREYETNLDKAGRDLNRNRTLYEQEVISTEEFEGYQHEYNKARNALNTLRNNQISKWQSDLNTYSNSYEEMLASMKQEERERDLYTVRSPITGSLDLFQGIYRGSAIQAGSLVAVVSPDSTLYAEISVSPRNIGYIGRGMKVNIQVGAFNYNEWGIITGKVTDISSDFVTDASGENAYYRVKCSLNSNHLTRKNGVRGSLKKGMAVSAHFMITRRSLFDLLYQKIDDWVNPAQYEK